MNTLAELKEKLIALLSGQSLQVHESTVDKLLHTENVPINAYPSAQTLFMEWLAEHSIEFTYNADMGCVVFEKCD